MSSGGPKDFWVREAVEEIYQQSITISQNYQQAMITMLAFTDKTNNYQHA